MFSHNSQQTSPPPHHDDNGEDDDPSLFFFPPELASLPYPPLLQDLITFQTVAPPPAATPLAAGQFPDPPLQPTQSLPAMAEDVASTGGKMRKNMIHKEVERQRRKEMAALNASLRNLLPLRFVKGKRAVSDQMEAAVEYIRELQRRVEELGKKRDELKNGTDSAGASARGDQQAAGSSSTASNCTGGGAVGSSSSSSSSVVMVRPCLVGVEVAIHTSGRRGGGQRGLQLSRVVELLMERGLDVVTCNTVRVNEYGFIHTLNSKVRDESCCIDVAELQSWLTRAMEVSREHTSMIRRSK